MAARKIGVNLAARPLRNRRFFFLLVGVMAALFLFAAVLSLAVFFNGRSTERKAAASLVETGRAIESARGDRDAWTAQVREWTKARRPTIDAVNGILAGKSFSWTDFFSRLEEAIPPSCLIVQMAPLVAREGRIEVRFKLSSPTLEELLTFIQKLNGQGFKNIAVRQEAQAGGRWITEIELTHERAL
jgi:hypothetical protein